MRGRLTLGTVTWEPCIATRAPTCQPEVQGVKHPRKPQDGHEHCRPSQIGHERLQAQSPDPKDAMTDATTPELYPQYCFHLSPTINRWCHFRITDILALRSHRGFQGGSTWSPTAFGVSTLDRAHL